MPVYVYECAKGHGSEKFFSVAEMQRNVKCSCGLWASQVIQPVAIHSVASFSRSIDDPDVKSSMASDGSYLDPTLSYCPETGKVVTPITSMKQRQQLMDARGLVEKEPSDKAKDVRLAKTRGRKIYAGVGSRA